MSDTPGMTGLIAYRIGGGKRYPHWAHRWHVDLWFRSWQAECDQTLWASRAWTRRGALRKQVRWYRNRTDLRKHERRYGRKPALHVARIAQQREATR